MKDKLTLKKLEKILSDRGFSIVLNTDTGAVSLRGRREQATPALMRVLGYFRDEIIAELNNGASEIREGARTAQQGPMASGEQNVERVLSGS